MTYDERVRAYEAEGMTRSDAQGIVDLEDLRQHPTPTMEYNAKAGKILDRMLTKRRGDAMSTHTPGPWKVTLHDGKVYIDHDHGLAEDYWTTAQTYGPQAEANAAFIVRACNSHAAMLEALKLARFALLSMPDDVKAHLPGNVLPAMHEAIRLAEGRP